MLLLALLGLLMVLQGVYAVTAAMVTMRGHELAVRSALGASGLKLAWEASRNSVLAVLAGAVLGIAAFSVVRPVLAHWLDVASVGVTEPVLTAVGLLALVAAAASFFPARTAARANPADALRQE